MRILIVEILVISFNILVMVITVIDKIVKLRFKQKINALIS